MSIYEYDEEKHMRQTREEGYEDGYDNGYEEGELSGSLKMCKELLIPRETAMKKIMEIYSLSPENAQKMMEKYWSDNQG